MLIQETFGINRCEGPVSIRKCLRCPFEDCINDEMTIETFAQTKVLENEYINPKTTKEKALAVRNKAYYLEHREHILAQKKAYRQKHPDAVAAAQKRYREKNREMLAAKDKARYAANREKVIARQKAYYVRKKRGLLVDVAPPDFETGRCTYELPG